MNFSNRLSQRGFRRFRHALGGFHTAHAARGARSTPSRSTLTLGLDRPEGARSERKKRKQQGADDEGQSLDLGLPSETNRIATQGVLTGEEKVSLEATYKVIMAVSDASDAESAVEGEIVKCCGPESVPIRFLVGVLDHAGGVLEQDL